MTTKIIPQADQKEKIRQRGRRARDEAFADLYCDFVDEYGQRFLPDLPLTQDQIDNDPFVQIWKKMGMPNLRNKRVAFYLPMVKNGMLESEPLPFALMSYLHRLGVRILLPKVLDKKTRNMIFVDFNPDRPDLTTDEFNIPCPKSNQPRTPDVVFAPRSAVCPETGYNTGQNGGFYDTTITRLRAQNPKLLFMGMIFHQQRIRGLMDVARDGDVPVDGMITEEGYFNTDDRNDALERSFQDDNTNSTPSGRHRGPSWSGRLAQIFTRLGPNP